MWSRDLDQWQGLHVSVQKLLGTYVCRFKQDRESKLMEQFDILLD